MDLISVLRAVVDMTKQVNDYSTSKEDAAKFLESFKPKLDSTRDLLESLNNAKNDDGNDIVFFHHLGAGCWQ